MVVAPDQRREIAGDLDTIIAKAMHRSAERRYASAQQLADDIRRHLVGLPVHARPDTVGYRLRKYAQRHRAAFAGAALSFVAISVGLFAAVWQSGVAAAKDREAQKRFMEVRDLANGLLGEVDTALSNVSGATAAREILARKVLHYLDLLARADVRDISLKRDLAVAYERLGEILGGSKASNLGNTAGAIDAYRKSVALHEQIAERPLEDFTYLRDRGRALSKYSDLLALTGDHAGALEQERKSLEIRQSWLKAEPNNRAAQRAVGASLQELAGDLDRIGRFKEALQTRREVIAIFQQVDASGPPETSVRMALALAYKRLGRSLLRMKEANEAQYRFERAVEIERAEVAKNPQAAGARGALAYSLNDLGMALGQKGDHRRAIAALRESYGIRQELAAADPNDWRAWNLLAASRFHLGNAIVASSDWRAGVAELRAALALREDLYRRSPANSGALAEVAETYAAMGDAMMWAVPPDAIPYYEKALKIYSDLHSAGKLSAEIAGEPARLREAIQRIRR
jgi:non-specific serine/threonine protein kinase/serine/threonine-protein kinase